MTISDHDQAAGDVEGCELSTFTTHELHELAVERALELDDVAFVWELLNALPADGSLRHQQEDMLKAEMLVLAELISDVISTDDGSENTAAAAGLRPLYLRYLRRFGFPVDG